jgi:hypothetical protein
MVLALLIGLPLGVCRRAPARAGERCRSALRASIQTIPGLALLALFYPLLLALSSLVGGFIPALGFLPALLALALYALLPILRNVVTGMKGIDPAVLQAADGVGMTSWQKLRLVEAPLAAPGGDGGDPDCGGVDDRRGDAWRRRSAIRASAIRSSPGSRPKAGRWCWPAASALHCWRSPPTG